MEDTTVETTVKKVLILNEKHGKAYYDASTKQLTNKALLSVLRSRMKSGGYYYEPIKPDTSRQDAYLAIPEETVKTLPEAVQKEIAGARREAKIMTDEYEADLEWYNNAVHLLSLPEHEALEYVFKENWTRPIDGKEFVLQNEALLWLFRERADFQYEGWEIVTLEIP